MEKSQEINELAGALSKAQGQSDHIEESKILSRMFYSKVNGSNQFTFKSSAERFFNKVIFGSSSCWTFKNRCKKTGYGVFKYKNEQRAHRVSYIFFKGNIKGGNVIMHLCNNKLCVNPDHLIQGPNSINIKMAWDDGLIKAQSGSTNGNSKLKEVDVLKIRQLLINKTPYKNIMEFYNISKATVYRINKKLNWGHL